MFSYTYDALNQLKTVTRGSDVYEYTYDNGGNILNVKLNGTVTDTYTYGDENWKDKLTSYNGETITYDEIGNPLQYRDGIGMVWENGRFARNMYSADYDITFITNADGYRIVKNVFSRGIKYYEYEYNGSLLVRQKWGNNTIWFLYDESGSPVGFTYNGTEYYYLKNVQGDITGITDANGTILAKYTYDVWGKILAITDASGNDVSADKNHIANINPLRYRGYYYDAETGFYYLLTRYYDPVTGRFISPDTTDVISATPNGLTDKNLYAYCDNNPVMRTDVGGEFWSTLKNIGLETIKMSVTVLCVTVAAGIMIGAGIATFMSGGTGAAAIPLAISVATAVVEAGIATATVTASVGVVTTATGVIGENIVYAKAGAGISEHTNGTKNWDKHSKKRAGDKEKGDRRRTNRIDKKKRNQDRNINRNTRRSRR